MPVVIGDPVSVRVSELGEPMNFVWQRFEYEIVAVPQRFFRRRSWWEDGAGLELIDHELWRVEATDTGVRADARTYDLQRTGEQWLLEVAWE